MLGGMEHPKAAMIAVMAGLLGATALLLLAPRAVPECAAVPGELGSGWIKWVEG